MELWSRCLAAQKMELRGFEPTTLLFKDDELPLSKVLFYDWCL
jgi:hypothetical protein